MTQLYERTATTLFTAIGNDVVALSVDKGQCYGMEQVTATVWNLLGEPIGIDAISTRVSEVYDVDRDTCRPDIERLIAQFQEEGLVHVVDPNGGNR